MAPPMLGSRRCMLPCPASPSKEPCSLTLSPLLRHLRGKPFAERRSPASLAAVGVLVACSIVSYGFIGSGGILRCTKIDGHCFAAKPARGPWRSKEDAFSQSGDIDEMFRRAGGSPEEAPQPRPIELRELRRKVGANNQWCPFPEKPASEDKLQGRLSNVNSLEQLLPVFNDDMSEWPAISVATAWHRLAKHSRGQIGRIEVQRACQRLATELERRNPKELSARELSNVMWALGVLRYKKLSVIRKLCRNAARRLQDFDAQAIANLVYALMMLEHKDTDLLVPIGDHVPDRIDEFRAQEISNIVYAVARLDFKHLELMRAISQAVPERVSEFKAQELSNLVYAFSLMKYRHTGVLTAICDHIPTRLREFNPQNIANTLYGIVRLEFDHQPFTRAMSQHMIKVTHDLRRKNLLDQVLKNIQTLQQRGQGSEVTWSQNMDPVRTTMRQRARGARR